MNDKNIVSQESKSEEEELLNFEFDDLSLEDVEQANAEASPEEDIIELVEVVEEGEQVVGDAADAAPVAEMDSDLASDELSDTVESSIPSDLERELDAALDGLESSLDLTEESQVDEASSTQDIESILDNVEMMVEKEGSEGWAAPGDVDSIATQLDSLDVSDLEIDEPGEIGSSMEGEGISEKPDEDLEQDMTQRLEANMDYGLDTIEPSALEIEEIEEIIEEEKVEDIEGFLEEEGLEEMTAAEQAPEETEGLETEIESTLEGLESLEGEPGEIAEEPALSLGDMEGEAVPETEVSEGPATDLPTPWESLEIPDEEASGLEIMESELEDAPQIGDLEEDMDLERAAMAEEFDMESEEPGLEIPSEPIAETSPDDLEQLQGIPEAPMAEEKALEELPGEMGIGVSEEKLEAIITKVVEDVVERVARETMVSVAEKVIKEAIDALKQSLEGPQE